MREQAWLAYLVVAGLSGWIAYVRAQRKDYAKPAAHCFAAAVFPGPIYYWPGLGLILLAVRCLSHRIDRV